VSNFDAKISCIPGYPLILEDVFLRHAYFHYFHKNSTQLTRSNINLHKIDKKLFIATFVAMVIPLFLRQAGFQKDLLESWPLVGIQGTPWLPLLPW